MRRYGRFAFSFQGSALERAAREALPRSPNSAAATIGTTDKVNVPYHRRHFWSPDRQLLQIARLKMAT